VKAGDPVTTIGRRNFAVSGPDIWNSLSDLRLSSLSTATFARHLKDTCFTALNDIIPAARLSFFKAALFISDFININIIIIRQDHVYSAPPYPAAGGEGARCPSPRTPPQLSSLRASKFSLPR